MGTYPLRESQVEALEAATGDSSRAGGAAKAAAGHSDARHSAAGLPRECMLPGKLPEAFSQAQRGSCVANAVAAMVEYVEGCRTRLSVQYLSEATRLVEDEWAERNLKLLGCGLKAEQDFEAAFPSPVRQLELLVKANGAGSPASEAFVASFGRQVRKRLAEDVGTRLKRSFEALARYGICRYELWPYARLALSDGVARPDALGEFPPHSHRDAKRHRIVKGQYILRSPNNVEEIKSIIAGRGGKRPMCVCAGVELFEGCDGEEFKLPKVRRLADGGAQTQEEARGLHEVLLIGYEDNRAYPGGGYFRFLNSWGPEWGERGKGKIPYAYVECFCREAGTILQKRSEGGARAGILAILLLAACGGVGAALWHDPEAQKRAIDWLARAKATIATHLPENFALGKGATRPELPASVQEPAPLQESVSLVSEPASVQEPAPLQESVSLVSEPEPVQEPALQPEVVEPQKPIEQPEAQQVAPAPKVIEPQPVLPEQPKVVEPGLPPAPAKATEPPPPAPAKEVSQPSAPPEPVEPEAKAAEPRPEPPPQRIRPSKRKVYDDDDDIEIERNLVEWRWSVRMEFDTVREAGKAYGALMRAKKSVFVFEPGDAPSEGNAVVSGTLIMEAPRSKMPRARDVLKKQLGKSAPGIIPKKMSAIPAGDPSKERLRR